MSDKPRVGEILVQAGVIDEMQLAAALGEQARWGRRLGVTLIKMGMVEEGHLIRALAKQLDLPVASLEGKRIADDVVALVPKEVASEYGVMPLFVKRDDRQKGQLFLGMEDPSNLAVLDDLTFRTGMQVFPVMVGPSELGAVIDRYYLSSSSSLDAESKAEGPIGEISLSVVADGADPSSSESLVQSDTPEVPAGAKSPSSREVEFELCDPVPAVPESLLEDVARAIEETEKTRDVAKAIAHLLIEKGVLSLEELQVQIAHQKTGDSS